MTRLTIANDAHHHPPSGLVHRCLTKNGVPLHLRKITSSTKNWNHLDGKLCSVSLSEPRHLSNFPLIAFCTIVDIRLYAQMSTELPKANHLCVKWKQSYWLQENLALRHVSGNSGAQGSINKQVIQNTIHSALATTLSCCSLMRNPGRYFITTWSVTTESALVAL